MDSNKILEVVEGYDELFENLGIPAIQFLYGKKPKSKKEILGHCRWMIIGIKEFIRKGKREKAKRHLGFIQGCLWTSHLFSLTELMDHNRPAIPATLCYPIIGQEVLLAVKKRRIGKDRWNGFGGGVEKTETIRQAAARELREESGLIVSPESLEKMAIINFHNKRKDGSALSYEIHVFLAGRWTGELKTTDEMSDPTWFDISGLPKEDMMPADRFWLPLILQGAKILGEVEYDSSQRIKGINLQGTYFLPEETGPTF
jgi:8-oxo-dGTP pyrophosphatase MutT (NUDIX family)